MAHNDFDIFVFDENPNDFSNLSQQRASAICKLNQREWQSIVDDMVKRGVKDYDFSKVPTAFLLIHLKKELLPDWWKRGEVYRNCTQQQWDKAALEGKKPEQKWIIEEKFPVKLPEES